MLHITCNMCSDLPVCSALGPAALGLRAYHYVTITYSFMTLSLTGSHRIMTYAEEGENILQQSLYHYYSNHTTHLTTSLLLFASEFSIYKGEIRKCTSPVIIRCFGVKVMVQ